MKRALFLAFILISLNSVAQKFKVTPDGLVNAEDSLKHFVVLRFDSLSAAELFARSLNCIEQVWKNTDLLNMERKEGEYLVEKVRTKNTLIARGSFTIKIYVNLSYTLKLNFKNSKIKYEIADLEMSSKNSYGEGTPFYFKSTDGVEWSFFTKEGVPVEKQQKALRQLENYFNNQLTELKISILSPASKVDF